MDGRKVHEWKTSYSGFRPKFSIYLEALYLLALLFGVPVLLYLVWMDHIPQWLGVDHARRRVFAEAATAWLGGLLGGTTFSMKWLYHSVARGIWHEDRRLWRLFTPHLSAALAFAVMALLVSGLVGVLDEATLRHPPSIVAITFLVGYFSDGTVAALARVAKKYLGET